jgi:hypothetical protein
VSRVATLVEAALGHRRIIGALVRAVKEGRYVRRRSRRMVSISATKVFTLMGLAM